jgi:hypothetical protein
MISCSKKPFNTQKAAVKFARTRRKRFSKRSRPYRCVNCPSWHLTTARAESERLLHANRCNALICRKARSWVDDEIETIRESVT